MIHQKIGIGCMCYSDLFLYKAGSISLSEHFHLDLNIMR